MKQMRVNIDGMSCGHCIKSVRSGLEQVDGLTVEQVGVGSAVVSFDPARVKSDEVVGAVKKAGYSVSSLG